MPLGTSFDLLSRIVEQYESEGRSVRSVEATTDDDGAVRATITVPAAFPSSGEGGGFPLVAESATVDGEGGVGVTFSASPVADVAERVDAAVRAEVRTASTTDDGELLLTVEVAVGPSDPGETAVSDADANRSSSEITGRADRSTGGRAAGDDAPTGHDSPTAGDGLATDGDGLAADNVEVTADGSSPDDGVDESPERVERTVEGVGDGSETPSSVVREIAAARDESVPPYDDVDYLERLYDACNTFDEMSRLIEMDVASETVRRYMIEAGVHVPTSYDTAPEARESEPGASERGAPDADPSPAHGADTDPSATGATERQEPEDTAGSGAASDSAGDAVDREPLVADGVGLPDGVRIPDVVDAVVESVTLHQLAQRLDLERGEARELLQQLNLLDFVPRRLPAEPEQELSHEDVTGRIRRSTPSARSA